VSIDTLDPGGLYLAKAVAVERRLNNLADANGIMRYTASDSNVYAMGSYRQHLASTTLINTLTTSPTGVMNPAQLLAGVTYRVQGTFRAVQNASVNSTQFFGWTGPATTFVRIFYQFSNATANAVNAWNDVTALGGANAISWGGAAGSTVELVYYGTVIPSANGPLTCFGACSNTANSYSIFTGSIFDVSTE